MRIPGLDGLRGMAILTVMIYHMTLLIPNNVIDSGWVAIASVGWCGVDLFFVLSGFLISTILLESKTQDNFLRNFWMRRVLRIFPLYYAVVVFSLLILPLFDHPKISNFSRIQGDEIWYWTFLSNYSIAHAGEFRHGILDISWSLAIEEQFYLLWPLLILITDRKQFAKLCVGIFIVSIVAKIILMSKGTNLVATYVVTPARMEGLAFGGLAAVVVRDIDKETLHGFSKNLTLISTALLLILFTYFGGLDWTSREVQLLSLPLFAILFTSILLVTLTASEHSSLLKILNNRILISFGKYSYAMYLFHLPLRALVRDTLYGPVDFITVAGSRLPGQILFYVISIGITLLAAWLSWHMYEKHFLRLKTLFSVRPTVYAN
jgi:peptidoglycan/LPS O-acetylase OafA/YrhL